MPKYFYRCVACLEEFEIYHSMKDKLTDCEHCNTSGSLSRVPSIMQKIKKVENKKVGSVVKQYIKDAKEDLKSEKNKMKRESL